MSEGRWRISVTAPDWGEDHLSLDAVVAFVDDELDPGPRARATRHAARCKECAAQVVAQTQARVALRTAAGPRLPSSLLSSLRSIPQQTDLPAPPQDLGVNQDGQIVCRARPEPAPRRRTRPDDAAPSSGPSSGPSSASPSVSSSSPAPSPAAALGVRAPEPLPADARPAGLDTPDEHGRRAPAPSRIRVGTGVAVSGLALGALAFGVTAAAPSVPAPAVERGVLGGSVLGGASSGPSGLADARLRLGTSSSRTDPTPDGLGRALRGLW